MTSKSTETLSTEEDVLTEGTLVGGRFRIVRKLAEGGMGRVYLANQEPIDRPVALKVMRRVLVSDELSVKRFLREAVAVSKLHHPNTITVLDYGEDPGRILYIAMEYLDGESLHQLLNREGGLDLGLAASIVSQVARSLAEAHAKGVIHRDLKPENIFISHVEGEGLFVKVLDFGIAKLQQNTATRITRTGYVCGTPEYMSPEQARGDEIDGTSDLYSLGVLLWEMLSGAVPFSAGTALGIVLKHQNEPVPLLEADVPDAMKAFIYRAMSKDRSERPQSAEEFLGGLLDSCPDDVLVGRNGGRSARALSMPSSTPVDRAYNTSDVALMPTMEEYVDLDDDPQTGEGGLKPRRRGALLYGLAAMLAVVLVTAVVVVNTHGNQDEVSASPMTEPVTIFVEAEPSGTTVFVDGNSRGMAPMNIRGLPGQDFDLKLMRNGFETFKTRVTFPEEALTKRSFNLWPTPEVENQVMVSISTTPPGAQVVRDKLHLGSAPFRFKLGRGDEPFKIELRMPGHETMEVMLDPGSGDQAISVPLEVIAETRGGHSQRSKGEHSAGAKVKTGKARSVKPQLPSEKTLERKRYRIVE